MRNWNSYNYKNKRKKAYSLVEILVSLGIMSIVITMLFNVLIVGLQSTVKVIARSSIREEMSNISGQITRDIRNSDKVTACGELTVSNSCEFFYNNVRYSWSLCSDSATQVCKYDLTDTSQPLEIYRSTPNMSVSTFEFAQGFGSGETEESKNVLFTIVGSHNNDFVDVNNVFRQLSISTRNYFY